MILSVCVVQNDTDWLLLLLCTSVCDQDQNGLKACLLLIKNFRLLSWLPILGKYSDIVEMCLVSQDSTIVLTREAICM